MKLLAPAAVAAAIGLAGSAARLHAADTWANTLGDGNWNQPSNWADNSVPLSSDAVTFALPGPVNHTVTLPTFPPAMVAQSLTFNDNYTLSNGRLDMAGAPIAVASGKTATINSQLGSSTGLTKTGDGTLVLGGNNTSTLLSSGDMTISAGTVRITSDSNLGSVYRTRLTGTLDVDGTFSTTRRFETLEGTINVTAGNTLSCTSNDQFGFSNGAIYKTGPGTLRVTGQSSRFGTNYVLGGTLRYESGVSFPQLGYGPIVMTDATFELVNVASGFPNVTVGANSIVKGTGNSGLSGIKAATGGDVFPTLSTGTSASDKLDVTVSSTFGGTISSIINISGAGTVKLAGTANNYAGGWNIASGTLRVTSPVLLGSGTSAIPVGAGGTMMVDNTVISRSFNFASGSALRGVGTSATTTGVLNVAAGASIMLGNLVSTDVFTITGGSNRLTGGAGGTITVDGPGAVQLVATSNYQGGWNLTGGTLRIYNDTSLGTGTAAIAIGGSAVLETTNGTRTIARDINLNGGTLRGASTGVYNGVMNVAAGASVTLARSLIIGDSPNDLTGGGAGTVIHVTDFGSGTTLMQPSNIVADWTLDSGGRLTIGDDAQLGAASNVVTLNHTSSHLVTTAPITSLRNLVFNAGSFDGGTYDSSFADVSGTSGTVAKTGAGTLAINRIRSAGLNVLEGAVKIKPNGTPAATSTLNTLSLDSAARMDLTDNKLIVRNTPIGSWDGAAYTDLTGKIASGRNGGTWDGAGIVTSMTDASAGGLTTLAIATAGDVSKTTFGGESVASTDVLVMYTYSGDADLSGGIDGDDFFRIDSAIGTTARGWTSGDFDYNGTIDADDYFIIDRNYARQGSAFAAAPAGLGSVSAVPEPTVIGLIAGGFMLVRRRRGATRVSG